MENCPDWVSGMLYIAGDGVALGYLNDEEKTREKFLFWEKTGERLYCTGDMGRYWCDGNIEILGRVDNQVKINGYRIELGEIESALMQILSNTKVVVAPDNYKEGTMLIAIIESPHQCDSKKLEKELRLRISDYAIPKRFINVSKLPLSSNGKVDRNQLNNIIESNGFYNVKEAILPSSSLEREVLNIFENIVRTSIDVEQDFFKVGGDSLKAIKLVSLLNKKYDIKITIMDLYDNSNVRKLSQIIQKEIEKYDEGIL